MLSGNQITQVVPVKKGIGIMSAALLSLKMKQQYGASSGDNETSRVIRSVVNRMINRVWPVSPKFRSPNAKTHLAWSSGVLQNKHC